jgi:hypothetical protein
MPMPLRALVLGAAVLSAALLAATSALAASTPAPVVGKCKAPSAKFSVAATSSQGVVFVQNAVNLPKVYGCLASKGKLFKLPLFGADFTELHDFEVTGPFAAYAADEEEPAGDVGTTEVVEVDLRTGKTVFKGDALVDAPPEPFTYSVDALALRANGALAWLTYAFTPGKENFVVRRNGKKGATIDRGADIQRGSLALSRGGTLYWTRGGTIKTATL